MSYPKITLVPMGDRRRSLCAIGEDLAAAHLQSKGMRIISRNWRTRFGELDIVAKQGETLVFVEVKARRSAAFAGPEIGVFGAKRQKLRTLAETFIATHRPRFQDCRFDVISIVTGPPAVVTHIEDAF